MSTQIIKQPSDVKQPTLINQEKIKSNQSVFLFDTTAGLVDTKEGVDVLYLDFNKIFDTLPLTFS